MEWLIKLSKPVDLIGILQITPASFKCAAAGPQRSGGWGGGLWPFPSCEEDKVAKQPSSVGEVGNRPQPLGFDPRPLTGFRGWRAGPTSGLPAFAVDHGPRTERGFFIETFGEPGHGRPWWFCLLMWLLKNAKVAPVPCPPLLELLASGSFSSTDLFRRALTQAPDPGIILDSHPCIQPVTTSFRHHLRHTPKP